MKVTFDLTTGSIFNCAKTQNPIVSDKSQLCPISPKKIGSHKVDFFHLVIIIFPLRFCHIETEINNF